MRLISLLVSPQQHKWETSLAYLCRLAAANSSRLVKIFKSTEEDSNPSAIKESGLLGQKFNRRLLRQMLEDCTKVYKKRPLRSVCSKCIKEGLPDIFDPSGDDFLEYCLFHDCKPIKHCPSCSSELRYQVGNYFACNCKYDLSFYEPEAVSKDVVDLYKSIAANVPYGVMPSREQLEHFELDEIKSRLKATWLFIWTDGGDLTTLEKPIPSQGQRWEVLRKHLGLGNFRLDGWAFHLGCWWKCQGVEFETESAARQEASPVPWDYLKRLLKIAAEKGCNGPSSALCATAGLLCKANKSWAQGDLLPKESGTYWRPRFIELKHVDEKGLADKRPDPFGDEPSETLEQVAQGCDYLELAVLQLVAIGGIQPLNRTHPRAWEFEQGELARVLRCALRKSWVSNADPEARAFSPNNSMSFKEFCSVSNIGDLIFRASMCKSLALHGDSRSIWSTRIVLQNGWSLKNNMWAQMAIHAAVKGSLSRRARYAAILAQCYLGYSNELSDRDLRLFCGEEPVAKGKIHPIQKYVVEQHANISIPKNLVWHRGALVNATASYQ